MRQHACIHWLDRVLAVCVVAALVGCVGSRQQSGSLTPAGDAPPQLPGAPAPPALPGSPGGAPEVLREPSYTQIGHTAGWGVYDYDGNVIFPVGSALLLSDPDETSWAMYAFNPDGFQPTRLRVGLDVTANGVAWVGLSNYSRGVWDWPLLPGGVPANGDATFEITPGQWLSEGGQFYVVVLAHGGTSVTVRYVSVEFDNGVEPVYSISGTVRDEHGQPIPGAAVMHNSAPFFEVQANPEGEYLIVLEAAGMSTISAVGDFDFTPALHDVTVNGNETGYDFVGMRVDVRGRIVDGNGNGVPGVGLTLDPGMWSATSGADGSYEFQGVPNGMFTITPLLAGYTFDPAGRPANVTGADVEVDDFLATGGAPTYSISGTILSGGSGVEDVAVTLTPGYLVAFTNSLGFYSFSGLANDALYTVTPAKSFWSFAPAARNALVDGSSVPNQDFTATPPPPGYQISGVVLDNWNGGESLGVPQATVELWTGSGSNRLATVHTSSSGAYLFNNVPDGSYKVQVAMAGYAWSGGNVKTVTVNGGNVNPGPAFIGALNGGPTWNNFAALLVSTRCLSCHRPESQTAVDPYMTSYALVKAEGIKHNSRIQSSMNPMPPGNQLSLYYRRYFQSWRDADFPQ